MSELIKFSVLGRAEPQGSVRAFVIAGKARLTSANPKMKGWRQEVGWAALKALADAGIAIPFAGQHVPVAVTVDWFFDRPLSIPKKRQSMVVKPDADKLLRATLDSLTGILYADDAQVVHCNANKWYGSPARTEITVRDLSAL